MNHNLSQIFKSIQEVDPPFNLEGLILAKIERESNKIIRKKKALVYAGLFSSALATVYAISVFGQEILQSDFWRIATLAFSDINIVAGNWYDYALSLLETFPTIYAALMLAPIFVLFLSLNAYFNLIDKNNYKHCKHI